MPSRRARSEAVRLPSSWGARQMPAKPTSRTIQFRRSTYTTAGPVVPTARPPLEIQAGVAAYRERNGTWGRRWSLDDATLARVKALRAAGQPLRAIARNLQLSLARPSVERWRAYHDNTEAPEAPPWSSDLFSDHQSVQESGRITRGRAARRPGSATAEDGRSCTGNRGQDIVASPPNIRR